MTDEDSDEPIGRRGPSSRSRSSRSSGGGGSSRKKSSTSSRSKAKRKIISSDEENDELVTTKTTGAPSAAPIDRSKDRSRQEKPKEPKSLLDSEANLDSLHPPEPPSLSPILGSSLEAVSASFSPVLSKGPPSPRHHQQSLCWKHRVNLIGEKVVDPMIHICDKCHLPILIYARMIPCKHVFCLECGRAADKVCYKCGDKVTRVEQTTLGKVFMCTHVQGKNREPCKRTYLSQRDLQAHIAHRHIKEKQQAPGAPVGTRDPRHLLHPRAHPQQLPLGMAHPGGMVHSAASLACGNPSLMAAGAALGSKAASGYGSNGAPGPPSLAAPPLPGIPVPPPVPSAASPYLTPPPVYPPQMVPPPSAVYAAPAAALTQYPGVPVGVGPVPPPPPPPAVPSFVHAPPPPPPTAYAPPPPPPAPYDDYGRVVVAAHSHHGHGSHSGHAGHSGHGNQRGAHPPWQQRPSQPPPTAHRDYRNAPTSGQQQHYYR